MTIRLRRLTCTLFLLALAVAAASSAQDTPPEPQGILHTTVFAQKPGQVFVVGHRAGGFLAPENTLAAIDLAVNAGLDGIELDVQKTASGHFVLMHDDTVERTTTGKGNVENLSLAEIQQLRIQWTPHEFIEPEQFPVPPNSAQFKDLRVPTLEEALQRAKGKLFVSLDLKGEQAGEVAAKVAELGMLGDVIIKVNSVEEGRAVLEAAPEAVLMGRADDEAHVDELLEALSPAVMHLDDRTFKPPIVERLHDRGVRVWVNTLGQTDVKAVVSAGAAPSLGRDMGDELGEFLVNTLTPKPKRYAKLRKRGADFIQTDNIVQVAKIARRWR